MDGCVPLQDRGHRQADAAGRAITLFHAISLKITEVSFDQSPLRAFHSLSPVPHYAKMLKRGKILKNINIATIIAALALAGTATLPAQAQTPGYDNSGCGWYIILGCSKRQSDAKRTLSRLGGSMVGGGAGSRVLNTSDVRGFRNGFYCVADGPYISDDDASSVAWVEAVPDAYVKRGC